MSVKAVLIFSVCMILNIVAAMYYIDYVDSKKKRAVAPIETKAVGMTGREGAILAYGVNQVIIECRQRDSAIMGEVMRIQHQLKMHTGQKTPLCPDCARNRASTKERFVSNN